MECEYLYMKLVLVSFRTFSLILDFLVNMASFKTIIQMKPGKKIGRTSKAKKVGNQNVMNFQSLLY